MSFYFDLHWLSILKPQVRTSLKPIASVCVRKDLEGQASQFFFTCVSDRIINLCVHSCQMSLLSYTCMHTREHILFSEEWTLLWEESILFHANNLHYSKIQETLRKVELASFFFFFFPPRSPQSS